MIKKIKHIFQFPTAIIQFIIFYLPGRFGYTLRYHYWRRRLRFLGTNVRIEPGVYFQNPDFISIDDDCWIDRGVVILAGADTSKRERLIKHNPDYKIDRGEVWIGKKVHIGLNSIVSGIGGVVISDLCCLSADAKIYSFSHHYRSLFNFAKSDVHFGSCGPSEDQFMIEGPIFLGKNVGVGLNVVILAGVSIQENSFIAIGSTVQDSFPSNSFISGNPAQRKKNRFRD